MHFAVAPVGSVLSAVVVGADFDAEGIDFATDAAAGEDCDIAPEETGVAGGADVPADAPAGLAGVKGAAGTAELAEAGDFGAFCTPPWPLQAPLPLASDVLPSLQVVDPPELVGAAIPPGDAGVNGAAGTAVAAGAAAADVDFGAFCTPPWPLQAPLPAAADVVPSLQVVGVVESA